MKRQRKRKKAGRGAGMLAGYVQQHPSLIGSATFLRLGDARVAMLQFRHVRGAIPLNSYKRRSSVLAILPTVYIVVKSLANLEIRSQASNNGCVIKCYAGSGMM